MIAQSAELSRMARDKTVTCSRPHRRTFHVSPLTPQSEVALHVSPLTPQSEVTLHVSPLTPQSVVALRCNETWIRGISFIGQDATPLLLVDLALTLETSLYAPCEVRRDTPEMHTRSRARAPRSRARAPRSPRSRARAPRSRSRALTRCDAWQLVPSGKLYLVQRGLALYGGKVLRLTFE